MARQIVHVDPIVKKFGDDGAAAINANFADLYNVGAGADLGVVRYVHEGGSDSTGDGLSWDSAYASFGAAQTDLSSGGTILFLGDITLTANLGISQNNLSIVGFGHVTSRILTDDFNNNIITINADDVTLENFAIIGGAAGTASDATGTLNGILVNTGSDRTRLKRLFISNTGYCGIRGKNATGTAVTGLLVEECELTLTGDHAIMLNWECEQSRIINNYIHDLQAVTANGIWVGNNSYDSLVMGNQIDNVADMGIEVWTNGGPCDVIGNVVDGSGTIGISSGGNPYGQVIGNTVRNVAHATAGHGIEIGSSDQICMGNTIQSVTGGTGDSGILVTGTISDFAIIGNYVTGVDRCVQFSGSGDKSRFLVQGNVFDNNGASIYIGGAIGTIDGTIDNNICNSDNVVAIFLESSGTHTRLVITNNRIIDTGSGDKGIWIYNAELNDVRIEDNFVIDTGNDGTGRAIYVQSYSGTVWIRRNYILGWGGAGGDGIEVGNAVTGTAVIEDNYIPTATNPILDSSGGGATVVIRRNDGFVTENRGQATLVNGQTAIVVTHGLAVTPLAEDISVHPIEAWGAATTFWVDTITSTQFTINVDQDPTQDVDFAWKIDK